MPAYSVSQITDPAISLHNGEVISIQVTGLNTGDNFKYRLSSSDLDTLGNTVVDNSVTLPFGFKKYPHIHLFTTGYTLNANPLTVDYNGGAIHVNPPFPPNTNPIDITNLNTDAGNYDISLKGTKIPGSITSLDYYVNGTIAAVPTPDPQILTFTIKNTNAGHLTVEVFDGASAKYSATYTITPQPPIPTPPTPGGSGDNPGSSSPPVAEMKAPLGYPSSSVVLQHNSEGKTLADTTLDTTPEAGFTVHLEIKQGTKVVTATGKPVETITLTPMDPALVPEAKEGVFSFAGIAAECEPTGTRFLGGEAILSFTLSPELWATTLENTGEKPSSLTIGFYDTASRTWIYVPATVNSDTRTVSARIDHFTPYGVIAKTSDNAKPSPAANTSTITPATPTTGSAEKPGIQPEKTRLAPPSVTKSPGLPAIVIICIICCVGMILRRRK